MVPLIFHMALTESCVADCMSEICWLISPVALAVFSASAFTSEEGNQGETAAGLAGARSFNGGVKRQQVGLAGDSIDQLDDVAYAAVQYYRASRLFESNRTP